MCYGYYVLLCVPIVNEMTEAILQAKMDAIRIGESCQMRLDSYLYKDLIKNIGKVVQDAVENDQESSEYYSADCQLEAARGGSIYSRTT